MQKIVFFIGLLLFVGGIAGCSFHDGPTDPLGWAAFVGVLMMMMSGIDCSSTNEDSGLDSEGFED
jgi:hypothetical protein